MMMTTITTLGAIVMTPLLCKLLLGTVVPVDAVGIAMSTVQVCNQAGKFFVCGEKRSCGATFLIFSGLRRVAQSDSLDFAGHLTERFAVSRGRPWDSV